MWTKVSLFLLSSYVLLLWEKQTRYWFCRGEPRQVGNPYVTSIYSRETLLWRTAVKIFCWYQLHTVHRFYQKGYCKLCTYTFPFLFFFERESQAATTTSGQNTEIILVYIRYFFWEKNKQDFPSKELHNVRENVCRKIFIVLNKMKSKPTFFFVLKIDAIFSPIFP